METFWIVIIIGVVLAQAPFTGGFGKVNTKAIDKHAAKQGLPLPGDLRPAITDRLVGRERSSLTWAIGGLLIGFLAVVLLRFTVGWDKGEVVYPPLVLGGVAVGSAFGSLLPVLRTTPLAEDRPRVARAMHTTVPDYVSKSEVICFFLVPVSLIISTVGMWVLAVRVPHMPAEFDGRFASLTGANIVLLAMWAAMLYAAHKLVASPQHAGNDLELAWDDAERTTALRALGDNAVSMAIIAAIFSLISVVDVVSRPVVREGAEDLTIQLALAAFIIGLVAAAIVTLPLLPGRLNRTPWRKLWPNVPAEISSTSGAGTPSHHTPATAPNQAPTTGEQEGER